MQLNIFRDLVFMCCLSLVLCGAFTEDDVKYRYFDDYLSSLNEDEQAKITGEENEIEGSGTEYETPKSSLLPLRTGLKRSKDEACCSLGQLAGDKGYHCYAKFYAARIVLRNQNRAHNRKLGFHGRYSVPNYGTKLMSTFERCVAGRGMVFHKCCHVAAVGRRGKPHYDSVQRKRFELKMRKITMPKRLQVGEGV